MSEKVEVKLFKITDTTRSLIEALIGKPLPEEAIYFATSEKGWTLVTAEDVPPAALSMQMPRFALFSYYEVTLSYTE